jgi:galactose-1-phosphate uridylyltransferase
MAEYERDIDEECKRMWNSVMMERLKESTRTKIRTIVNSEFGKKLLEVEAKTNEHDGVLSALLRGAQQFISSAKKK